MVTNFNQNYTFNSFIVNEGNELVFAVAKAITKEPLRYNPFFHSLFIIAKIVLNLLKLQNQILSLS